MKSRRWDSATIRRLMAFTMIIICFAILAACKRATPSLKDTGAPYYPLFSAQPFALADSLHYFYNTIDVRGTALSGGEFFVFLKYPVFRSEDKKIERLVDWLDKEIFILAHNGNEDNEALRTRFKADYPGYANHTLNSWLATEETTKMGCMEESLAVEVVMNSEIITLKVHHRGYWGGAHGDNTVRYAMFDREYNLIDVWAVIAPDKASEFKMMLISEYNKQIVPWQDYDDAYKTTPDYIALIPEGLIVIYPGFVYAEGQPAMVIQPGKFLHLLRPQYQKIISEKKSA